MGDQCDPLKHVTLTSAFLEPVRLSFDIDVKDDTIHAAFRDLPDADRPWYASYYSSKYGSGTTPVPVAGGAAPPLEEVATALCEAIRAPNPERIRNIRRNYIDLNVPEPVRRSLVQPNHPPQNPKPVRMAEYVLFADLRGFSEWSLTVSPEHVAEIYEVISERVGQMLIDFKYDYWKLLGDGIMLVWELHEDEPGIATGAIDAAYELHKKYWYYRRDALTAVPEGFGIAICGGYVTKYMSSTFFESVIVTDYIGPIVNQAARLQQLAGPGEVLVNRRAAKVVNADSYSFEDVTTSLETALAGLKGLASSERQVFKVRHKHFKSDWERFAIRE